MEYLKKILKFLLINLNFHVLFGANISIIDQSTTEFTVLMSKEKNYTYLHLNDGESTKPRKPSAKPTMEIYRPPGKPPNIIT